MKRLTMYNELQSAIAGTARLMRPIIDRKPSQKEVALMQQWEKEIQPYRTECVRLTYEAIEILKKGN